jgi:AcrR family transcriptional regulator
MNTKRAYTMTARAEAAEETRMRNVLSACELQAERLTTEISLEDVAARAGVSVQTVLRRFGSKARLFEESLRVVNSEIAEERRAPAGDVTGAIRVLVDHYEKRGEFALMMLAQERAFDHVRRMSDAGKQTHRTWVTEVFAPYLPDDDARREELVDLLVVATDVYTWKLLRRDRGHSRARTEQRIHTLVSTVLAAAADRKDT